jgi:L-fuconolactonase
LLFGSDWPVSLLAASYERVFEVAGLLLDGLDTEERAAVFGRTAARIYNLEA